MVTTVPGTFGAFLVPFARHLRDRGWSVDLATGAGELDAGARNQLDRVFTVPWSRRLSDHRNATAAFGRMRRIIDDGGYAVMHTHTPIASFVARAVIATLPPARRPATVYTAHGFHFIAGQARHKNAVYQGVEWLAGRFTDRLIVINDADHRAALQLGLVRQGHVACLPGIGIDLDWYRATPEVRAAARTWRESLDLDDQTPLLSMITELNPGKNHLTVIRALARAKARNLHLALAGEGPMKPYIEAEITRQGLGARVHWTGYLHDVRGLIVASAATVLPSSREGLSRVVLESLALGTPVIGTTVRGIQDSVHPDGGILVPPGDVDALARAFERVAGGPLFDDATASRVRRRLERFSLPSIVRSHEVLYEQLLRDRPGPRSLGPHSSRKRNSDGRVLTGSPGSIA